MSDLFRKKGMEMLGELCIEKEILPDDDRWQLGEELKMLAVVENQILEAHANLARETVENPVVRAPDDPAGNQNTWLVIRLFVQVEILP